MVALMLRLRQMPWVRRLAFVAIDGDGPRFFEPVPAGAVFRPGRHPGHWPTRGANTQLTLSGTGPGQAVNGYIANTDSAFDPPVGLSDSDPTPDFSPKYEGFAGVIYGAPAGRRGQLDLYCIDINTDTYIGNGYVLGTWDEANVPNVGYVARILDEYYPNTDEPSSLTDEDQRAAAVQAAIWFFSDRFVLNTSDPLYSTWPRSPTM